MTWDTVIQTALTFLASIGGAGLVFVALVAWFGKIWESAILARLTARQNKELEKIKNENNLELERIRAELTRQRDSLANISTSVSSGYMATHPHIVDAIKNVWLNILEIKEISSTYLLVHNLLPAGHIENLTPKYVDKQIYMTHDEFNLKVLEIARNSDKNRPFIGERLWTLYHVYRSFTLRICIKMHLSQKNSNKLFGWNKDEKNQLDNFLLDNLKIVFTESEMEYINNISVGAPSQILQLLEGKILSEMNELVFGKRMLSMSIEEQQKVAELFSKS